MKSLTIISHTEHYRQADGQIVGLAATVMEINQLLTVFDSIVHVAMLHPGLAPENMLAYSSSRIQFVEIPAVGGKTLVSKLHQLYKMPRIVYRIHKYIKRSTYFQFRAPTGMGVFVIPYLLYFYKGKGWFKYAGDWSVKKSPVAYRFQRFLLLNQSRKVTINGVWENQPPHCLTFENPCLTNAELESGKHLISKKNLPKKGVHLCFVGRLEAEKGLDLFLNALAELSKTQNEQIAVVHIVGDGLKRKEYEAITANTTLNIVFYGALSREAVHDIFRESHALVLPSATEGFPKVIAEAMNYGCIPIVSSVSAIGNYIIHNQTGFLLSRLDVNTITKAITNFLNYSPDAFNAMQLNQREVVFKFTYNYYNAHIEKTIL